MSNKRRISGGKSFLTLSEVDDDDDNDDAFEGNLRTTGFHGVSRRTSLGGRRRSSFGSQNSSKSPISAVEQARIAEMYKTVIKMSSENKINDKNSWQFDLIDHMGKLIKDDAASQRGINFQKASCTLDASVKIYSHRVDDTHASSHRILESLSRTYTDDNDTDGEPAERGAARVGTKAASNRLNIDSTIEKDVEKNLNAPKVDSVHTADPLFHKMSKAFDEGGAKGMLMTNLRVSADACSLLFTSAQTDAAPTTATDATEPAAPLSNVVDVSDLIFKCGFSVSDLILMTVTPALDEYRAAIGVEEKLTGCFDATKIQTTVFQRRYSSSADGAAAGAADEADSHINDNDDACGGGGGDYGGAADYGGDDDYDDDDFGGDCGGVGGDDDHVSEGDAGSSRRESIGRTTGKIQWEALVGDSSSSSSAAVVAAAAAAASATEVSDTTPLSARKSLDGASSAAAAPIAPLAWQSTGITSSNDYAFLDIDSALKTNSWAGARHWKYATRRQTAAAIAKTATTAAGAATEKVGVSSEGDNDEERDGDDDEEEAAVTTKKAASSKSKKSTKDKFEFNFSGEFASEELFEVPAVKKGANDPTRLTAAALEKESNLAEEGGMFLPPDAKLHTRDLCRLLMVTNILVPPPMLAHHFLQPAANSSDSRRNGVAGSSSSSSCSDVIWGQARRVDGATAGFSIVPALSYGDNEDDRGYDGDNGGGFYEGGGADDDDDDDDNGDFGSGGGAGDDDYFESPSGDGYSGDFNSKSRKAPEQQGLAINTAALLKASRTVEKIDIGYATIAKRVNVKKLKTDIWTLIDELPLPSASSTEDGLEAENKKPSNRGGRRSAEDDEDDEEEAGAKKKPSVPEEAKLSFQDLVRDISIQQNQKDATLPFYFICLLHLANEKTLRIDGSPNMSDLIISKDA